MNEWQNVDEESAGPHVAGPAVHEADDRHARDLGRMARRGAVVIALIMLGVSIVTAFVYANQIMSTWLLRQWVPVARLFVAMAFGALAVWVLVRLTRRA